MAQRDAQAEAGEYIELCENEVLETIGITYNVVTGQNRPALDFFFQSANGWTYERLVQVLFVRNCMQSKRSSLLVELYYEEPHHPYQQLRDFEKIYKFEPPYSNAEPSKSPSEKVQRLLKDLRCDSLDAALKPPKFLEFLVELLPLKEGTGTTFKRLAMETAGLVLDRTQRSKAFSKFITHRWTRREFLVHTGGEIPLLTGIRRIFSRKLDRFQQGLVDYIKTWSKLKHDKPLGKSVYREIPGRCFNDKPEQFLFAPSGSGKTTSIFDELSRFHGFYMVACALPRHESTLAQGSQDESHGNPRRSILSPKILRGISADTRELLTMLQCVQFPDSEVINTDWRHSLEACRR